MTQHHDEHSTGGQASRYEEFTATGSELVRKVKDLIAEGNVRRLHIKNEDGKTLLEIPLTAGVAITAVAAAMSPVLVAVGAIAAIGTKVTIGVERREDSTSGPEQTPEDTPPPLPGQ